MYTSSNITKFTQKKKKNFTKGKLFKIDVYKKLHFFLEFVFNIFLKNQILNNCNMFL